MKLTKKIIAVVMALMMTLSIGALTANAATVHLKTAQKSQQVLPCMDIIRCFGEITNHIQHTRYILLQNIKWVAFGTLINQNQSKKVRVVLQLIQVLYQLNEIGI